MSKVRLYGDTSGFVDLKAPDVASNVTITLPNTTGPFATETYVDTEIAAIPEIAGIGSNVVQTVKTDTFSTTSQTYTEILSASITPTSATSKILVVGMVPISAYTNRNDFTGQVSLFKGATNLSVPASPGSRIPGMSSVNVYISQRSIYAATLVFLDSPASTSSVSYSVRGRTTNAGLTLYANRAISDTNDANHSRMVSSLTLIEVAA